MYKLLFIPLSITPVSRNKLDTQWRRIYFYIDKII